MSGEEASMKMTRKEFLAMLGLAGAGVGLGGSVGCGGDDKDGHGGTGGGGTGGTGGTGGPGGTGGTGGTGCAADIAGNHDHTLAVPQEDVSAGADKTYTLAGPHSHSLAVTAADFAKLAGGESVTIQTTGGPAHEHQVTITCA
jgi:hypothetical protein